MGLKEYNESKITDDKVVNLEQDKPKGDEMCLRITITKIEIKSIVFQSGKAVYFRSINEIKPVKLF